MAKKLTEFQTRVDALLQDAANSLASADKDAAIVEAIQKKYSKDVPLEVVTDVVSDGTRDLPLPVVNAGPVFEDGFSDVKSIEYPIGQDPEAYLDVNDFKLYRSPTGLKIRTRGTVVTNADNARLTWTARHLADASTVYAGDFDAVCCLAASIAFEQLAAKYTQSGDSTVSADVVNYRTKNQEYLALAKSMFKRYADHVDLNTTDNGSGGSPQKAALAIGDMDNTMATGIDRIIHGKNTR